MNTKERRNVSCVVVDSCVAKEEGLGLIPPPPHSYMCDAISVNFYVKFLTSDAVNSFIIGDGTAFLSWF